VLLTGIHLMRTGQIEANLVQLNEVLHLPYIPELIECKLSGPEKSVLPEADLEFYSREYQRLMGELEAAQCETHLPQAPTAKPAVNDLLVRVRMGSIRLG
jgi:uncharacterized protein